MAKSSVCFGLSVLNEARRTEKSPVFLRVKRDDPESELMSFDRAIARLKGLSTVGLDTEKRRLSSREAGRRNNTIRGSRSEIEGAVRETGVVLVRHGFQGHVEFLIAASRSLRVASSYGSPNRISGLGVESPEWRDQLKAFCELVDIPHSEPGWTLCCHVD